jgi:hypothetical protein
MMDKDDSGASEGDVIASTWRQAAIVSDKILLLQETVGTVRNVSLCGRLVGCSSSRSDCGSWSWSWCWCWNRVQS